MKWWLVLVFLVAAHVADARPGGGQSSSRSSSSSSSSRSSSSSSRSSSGGGGENLSPGAVVGFIVVIVIFVIVGSLTDARKKGDSWSSSPTHHAAPVVDLAPLVARDPDFSRVVFEDFVFDLYSTAQRTRGDPAIPMAPYLEADVASALAERGPSPTQVVIGTLRVERSTASEAGDHVSVRIEATLFERVPVYVVEHWRLSRAPGVISRPPSAHTRTFPCPNCGAPWTASATSVCASCGQDVAGRFDWKVDLVRLESASMIQASLIGTVEEYGNDLPTVIDPAATETLAAITKADPAVTLSALIPRVHMIYAQLNTAWNANDLTPVRGLVTASLRNYLDYWLRQYALEQLQNRLDVAAIQRLDLAKVVRDKYFDAITLRVFASGLDYTIARAQNDRLVGGSATTPRAYTEYWTFIRASTRRGPVTATPTCPNCGAGLKISDVGDCTHCNATVENGSFDWTLSKVEQDDSYAG